MILDFEAVSANMNGGGEREIENFEGLATLFCLIAAEKLDRLTPETSF